MCLPDPPRDGKIWRARGVAAYRSGQRPSAAEVFRQVAAVYDRFLDFSRSLADQATMSELSACFSWATWLAPATTVLGYPWPNGERGCGKTHWGTCWAETSYLGEVVLSSGSFAALRDLADHGAALCFDDAETLADPKRSDPQKRELLLAGNRRGAAIPLKEPTPDGRGWSTRYVNAFCPRAFTAIKLPDEVLASRSIIIPLARTADPRRGNADPADPARWPVDKVALLDTLWATALHLLPEAADVWAELDDESATIGRELEPWRAVLLVARLFERHGVTGLEQRIRGVMAAYQREKPDLLEHDRTAQVVRGLLALAFGTSDVSDDVDVTDVFLERVAFTAAQVADAVKCLEDGTDTPAWADGERDRAAKRIGHTLKRLRIGTVERAPGRKRERQRVASRGDVFGLARSYGVLASASHPPSEQTSDTSETVTTSDAAARQMYEVVL